MDKLVRGAALIAVLPASVFPMAVMAQAGFGIGMRVVQAGFMQVVEIGFLVAPVEGQKLGDGMGDRVKAMFKPAELSALLAALRKFQELG